MFKRAIILAAAAVALSAASAFAQSAFPTADGRNAVAGSVQMCVSPAGVATSCEGTPITASSGNVANASAAASLAAATGVTTYICGFQITSTGSTVAAVVSPTVVGVITGTMTYTYASVAGATATNQPLQATFSPCVPASAPNTAIVVTLPALGAGNTNATVAAQGFRR